MYSDPERMSVVFEAQEVQLVTDAHELINRVFNKENIPPSLQGTDFRLPEPDELGRVMLSSSTAYQAHNAVILAEKAAHRAYEHSKQEYLGYLDSDAELGTDFMHLLEDVIVAEKEQMIAFHGLKEQLHTTLYAVEHPLQSTKATDSV